MKPRFYGNQSIFRQGYWRQCEGLLKPHRTANQNGLGSRITARK